MKRLFVEYPRTPYTNEEGNAILQALGYPFPLPVNQSRQVLIHESIVLGKNMSWGKFHDNMATIHYTGQIPQGVYIDLQKLIDQGVISEWYLGDR